MPVLTTFNCDALTGGTARALDAIPVASLVDGCRALVALNGAFLVFVFDADGTDAEEVDARPYKIQPDDYSSAGVWIEQWTGAPNKNWIINPEFTIWQRGVVFTTPASQQYCADRWIMLDGCTVTRLAGNTLGNDAENALRLYYDGVGAKTYRNLSQRIEKPMGLSNQWCTLSFWSKAGSGLANSNAYAWVGYFDGSTTTGNLLTSESPIFNADNTWGFFQFSFLCPEINNSDDAYLIVKLHGNRSDGAAFQFDFTQVKLELGTRATPFVARPHPEELALCQRYFFKTYNQDIAPGQLHWKGCIGHSAILATPKIFYSGRFPVTMRTAPTVTFYSVTGAAGNVCDHTTGSNIAVTGAANIGEEGFQNINLGAAPAVADEIYFHYTADAEL